VALVPNNSSEGGGNGISEKRKTAYLAFVLGEGSEGSRSGIVKREKLRI
jgi:hypothetical protein